MTRDIPHAASFYAFLSHGLGPVAGLAGAAVSLLSYYVVQLSLYGLLGAISAGLFGGPWWAWALAAWLAVGFLGVLHIGLNTRLLAVILVLELVVIALVDMIGFLSPADGQLDFSPLQPGNLLSSAGLGGVLAFGIASFIGFESVAVYREEAVSHRSVVVACYGTIGFLSIFYAVSSWALALAVGPGQIIDTSRDPAANLPFGVLGDQYGPFMQAVGQALLLTGLFAALLSFHNVVTRYIYSLARETVLPSSLGTLGGAQGGVPVVGSVALTSTVAVGIGVFAIAAADPLTTVFAWGAELCSLGLLVLMICTSIAVIRYYRSQGRPLGFKLGLAPLVQRSRPDCGARGQHRQHGLDYRRRFGHPALGAAGNRAAGRRGRCGTGAVPPLDEPHGLLRDRPRCPPSPRGSGTCPRRPGDVRAH